MADQLTSAQTCRVCGALLGNDEFREYGLCPTCAGAGALQGTSQTDASGAALSQFEARPSPTPDVLIDPDHPHWGPVAGVSVWLGSVAAIVLLPSIAVLGYYLIQLARGAPVPSFAPQDDMHELRDWLMSPRLLLIQVLTTIVAHAITIAVCWAVVTKMGTRQFWASLGWNWAGRSVWYWLVFSACVIVGLEILSVILLRFLPQSEDNSFTELLRSSQSVRIAVAVLATFSAPIVEEVVYRGVLFPGLRKRLGVIAAIVVVTLLFPSVHLLQYKGAWVTMSGLLFLSLILTLVRARTSSVLPCVTIHFVNNAFFSVLILFNKVS